MKYISVLVIFFYLTCFGIFSKKMKKIEHAKIDKVLIFNGVTYNCYKCNNINDRINTHCDSCWIRFNSIRYD